jgi:hypothetical protein
MESSINHFYSLTMSTVDPFFLLQQAVDFIITTVTSFVTPVITFITNSAAVPGSNSLFTVDWRVKEQANAVFITWTSNTNSNIVAAGSQWAWVGILPINSWPSVNQQRPCNITINGLSRIMTMIITSTGDILIINIMPDAATGTQIETNIAAGLIGTDSFMDQGGTAWERK